MLTRFNQSDIGRLNVDFDYLCNLQQYHVSVSYQCQCFLVATTSMIPDLQCCLALQWLVTNVYCIYSPGVCCKCHDMIGFRSSQDAAA